MMEGIHWVIRNDQQRKHVINVLTDAQPPLSVKIGPVHSPKTNQQLRYAHSLCNALAAHYGIDPELAKRDAKAEYGVVIVHTSIVTGNRTARLKSFADYTKDEMESFISAMEAHLSERQIEYTPSAA